MNRHTLWLLISGCTTIHLPSSIPSLVLPPFSFSLSPPSSLIFSLSLLVNIESPVIKTTAVSSGELFLRTETIWQTFVKIANIDQGGPALLAHNGLEIYAIKVIQNGELKKGIIELCKTQNKTKNIMNVQYIFENRAQVYLILQYMDVYLTQVIAYHKFTMLE